MIRYNKKLMCASLVIYIILLIWSIIFKWTDYEVAQESIITFKHLNLAERYVACRPWFFQMDFLDFACNILLFLPMGLFFVLMLKRRYLVILIALILTTLFEVSQFFTCIGMFNFFDILSNVLGCVLGYIMFVCFNHLVSKRFIDVTNVVIIILFSPLSIYAITMTIINFKYYI